MVVSLEFIDIEEIRHHHLARIVFHQKLVCVLLYLVSQCLYNMMMFYQIKIIQLFLAPEQLQWQAQEMGVLVCFNLATYLETDGCSGQMVPDTSLFKPSLLNTDNWVQSMIDFGAVYAVLVAKVKLSLFCEYSYFS